MSARFRPSPAMIVACLALVVALGGTSYAVTQLPSDSVGTKQLKRNAVVSSKVKDNTITGADVDETTLGPLRFALRAGNANKLGGNGPSAFLAASGKAVDAQHADSASLLDNLASSDFLRSNGKALDAVHADNASVASDSQALGGVAASSYVQRCDSEAVNAVAIVGASSTFSSTYTTSVGGVTTCNGSSVEARRVSQGVYDLRFNGLSEAASLGMVNAAGSGADDFVTTKYVDDETGTPPKPYLEVNVRDADGGAEDVQFTIVLLAL